MAGDRRYRIFISHSKEDTFVVEDAIKPKIDALGAKVFVAVAEIEFGDDIRGKIFEELKQCDELVVLCTRSALTRPWIFAEVGAMLLRKKRIVLVLYGPTDTELRDLGIWSLMGPNKLLKIDDFKHYIPQLAARVAEHQNG
jgi:hypothetical protein